MGSTSYAALDIQSFHVELRSSLDYVASAAREFFPNPGATPESFRKMLNWLENNTGRADGRVETLILQQKGWFGEFRGARDLLVHSGGETLVFGGPADGILFQIYKGWEGIIEHPYLMFNDNVLYFDRYAAFYLARLLVFWEELATVLVSMFPWNHKPNAQAGATGFLVLKKWMESLLCVVQESKTA